MPESLCHREMAVNLQAVVEAMLCHLLSVLASNLHILEDQAAIRRVCLKLCFVCDVSGQFHHTTMLVRMNNHGTAICRLSSLRIEHDMTHFGHDNIKLFIWIVRQ